jgi:hypothetical protein
VVATSCWFESGQGHHVNVIADSLVISANMEIEKLFQAARAFSLPIRRIPFRSYKRAFTNDGQRRNRSEKLFADHPTN